MVSPLLRQTIRAAATCLLSAFALTACGGEDPPAVELPSDEQVRDYFAVNNDSCWRYKYRQGNANLFRRVDITGPNMTSISGHTVYVRKVAYESGGGLPREWYLESAGQGELRMLRSADGRERDTRATRRYETGTTPLFGQLEFDFSGKYDLEVGARFTTEASTPDLCTGIDQSCAPGPAERHEWTVASEEMVTTPDGQEMAFKMSYKVTDDARSLTEFYWLVPGKGIAKFSDSDGTSYQVCDWRVCDSKGECVGAASCAELACN